MTGPRPVRGVVFDNERPVRGVVFDNERPVRGVVFDKDGTLLDFHATWDAALGAVLADFAAGDAALLAVLDRELGFDRARVHIDDDSPFVADSSQAFADKLAVLIGRPAGDVDLLREIDERIDANAPARATPEAGADELLRALAERNVPMAVATNDNAARARPQLAALGWGAHLGLVFGADSGHGEKPGPGMVVAAAAAMGLDPTEVVMVGDSSTDIGAGNAAGAVTALYGGREDLIADANIVLDALTDLLAYVGG
ncbi:MAG: HAD-IA family hydrolase [Actinomycetota bacterium]